MPVSLRNCWLKRNLARGFEERARVHFRASRLFSSEKILRSPWIPVNFQARDSGRDLLILPCSGRSGGSATSFREVGRTAVFGSIGLTRVSKLVRATRNSYLAGFSRTSTVIRRRISVVSGSGNTARLTYKLP